MARSLFVSLAVAGALFSLTGCTATPAPGAAASAEINIASCAGVQVLVDFADLGADPIDSCVDVSEETPAAQVAELAGLTTQGTGDYGDAIVCRVNGEPQATDTVQLTSGSYTEDCADMPSADAYWSVWVRTNGVWDYAPVGFNELTLAPGQAVALLYDVNNAVTAPAQ